MATLGLIGTSATSNDIRVATATITNGKVNITSVGPGTATITVTDGTNTATIEVTIAVDGEITIGEVTKHDSSATPLDLATAAVAKAEGSKTQADVDAAQDLVDALPPGADKDALQERLDAVKAGMAVAKAEGSKTQADVDAAQDLVNALPVGADKDALQERLDAVKAEMAVAKAEGSKTQADVDAAQDLVNALPVGADKDALQERLDAVKAEIAVAKAEASQSQADIDEAQILVTALPTGAKKDALQQRLDNVGVTVELGKLTGKVAIEVAEVAGEETEVGIRTELTDGLTVAPGYTLSITDYSYDADNKVVSYKLTVAKGAGTATASSTVIEADVTTAAVDPILEQAVFITSNRDVKLVFTETLLSGTTIKFNSYDGTLVEGEDAFTFNFNTGAQNNQPNTVIMNTPADMDSKVAAGQFTYKVYYRPAVADDPATPGVDETADAWWEIVE